MKCIKTTEDIFGIARIGYSGNLEVYVNTNDSGHIPHFHLRDKDDWEKFHTCIRIDKPEYFLHEGKSDTLNAKQRRELQVFMESPVSVSRYKDIFDNNWQLVCFMWDLNNSDIQISEKVVMPNYNE